MTNPASQAMGGQSRQTGWLRAATAAMALGTCAVILLLRRVPPAPVFSPALGRATYWQSYETSYFASLRSYEEQVGRILAEGNTPVVVFGDSTFRGTSAAGQDVWTRILERWLRESDPRIRVVNYAQNAGDLMGPFLYHHLRRIYPQAYYVMQWHFSSEVGVRHPFHFWLTSEIALRDGDTNPAVRISYPISPVKTEAERSAFALAATNLASNYLDVGNWVRYLWLGQVYCDSDRMVKLRPLREVADTEVPILRFIPPDEKTEAYLANLFSAHVEAQERYVKRPFADLAAYFATIYPAEVRSHLILVTLDYNPHFAPWSDPEKIRVWRANWEKIRSEMPRMADLQWISLTGADGGLSPDDFSDLGHLTVRGQAKLASAVTDNLTAAGGWFPHAHPENR